MQKYFNVLQDKNGRVQAGLFVQVLTYPAGASASLFSDNGVTPQANPITTSINGEFSFYAADGRYSLRVYGGNIQAQTYTDIVLLEDPEDGSDVVFDNAEVETLTVNTSAEVPADTTFGGTAINGQSGSSLVGFIQSGTGATARTVQSKLRDSISVKDFGAVGDSVTNDLAAFQASYDAAETGQQILIPEGVYVGVSGLVTGSKFVTWIADGSVSGGSAWVLPGVVRAGFTNRLMFNVASTDGGDFGRVEFRRITSHTNGNPGDVSSNLRVTTTVNNGPDNFEWGFLSVLNNGALGAGENVAIYGQANKSAGGAGPTWAGVFEARNANNTAETGGGLVGIEVDVFANGADTSTNRVGIDLVIGKGDTGGTTPIVTYGIRIAAQNGVSANGTYTNAISIQNAATTGIEIASTGTNGIKFSSSATLTVGIDFSATAGLTSAIRFARSQKIDLEPTSTLQEDTAAVQNVRRLLNSGTERVGFDLSGGASTGLRVNATKVVGAQESGFAAFTGTTNKGTTYATGTVTLVQLAERVAALQAALTTHGLITI
jgi:hypothetical protein